MNTRPTEQPANYDLRFQLELERLLAAKRAGEAAREERYRRLRTPSMVEPEPEPEPETETETLPLWVAWALMCALSLLLTLAAWSFAEYLLPMLWRLK